MWLEVGFNGGGRGGLILSLNVVGSRFYCWR